MRRGKRTGIFFLAWMAMLLFPPLTKAQPPEKTRVAVFNFGTLNIEASGYGTTVTNMLLSSLQGESSLDLLDRKELETFLSLNDMQQNDNPENMLAIGTRLGMGVIVAGNVQKKGSIIAINCKAVHVEQKKVIFQTQVRTPGDAGILGEVRKLCGMLTTAIAQKTQKQPEETVALGGPINLRKRSGDMRVSLSWENPPGCAASTYDVYRSSSQDGPFVRITRTLQPEYLDVNLERDMTYYYKVCSYDNSGRRSEFSVVIPAEATLTPNPPVILNAEGHARSIKLVWSPNPVKSDDPLKMKGYKLYRAKLEQGPYQEVANLLGRELDMGIAADTTTLDKIFKVAYLDKELADGEEYCYRVTAYNEKNLEGEFSGIIKATTLPVVAGTAVESGLIREVRMKWHPASSPFVKNYMLYRSLADDSDFTKIKKIEVDSRSGDIEYTDKEGLADNTKYNYRITAVDENGNETIPSATATAATRGKPSIPEGLNAKSGMVKKVKLSWDVSSETGIAGYNIYRSSEKTGRFPMIKRIEGRDTDAFTDDGGDSEKLEDNATCYYCITAFNKVDAESDLSKPVEARTKARPAKPSGFRGRDMAVKRAPLAWNLNSEGDIEEYSIFRREGSESGDFSSVGKVDGETGVYVDNNLKDGAIYQYRIQVRDKDKLLSDFSDTISIRTKPCPRKPMDVSGEVRNDKVEISWSPNRENDIDHYVVYEKNWYGREKIAAVKESRFSKEGLPKGKTKTFLVTAVDKDGLESDPCQEILIEAK